MSKHSIGQDKSNKNGAIGEVTTRAWLIENGIPTERSFREVDYNLTDLISFGEIPVEIKYASLSVECGKYPRYGYRLMQSLKHSRIYSMVIILCAQKGNRVERTIWDADDPIFYRNNGELLHAIHYHPTGPNGRRIELGITPRLWNQHIDRFDILYAARKRWIENGFTPQSYYRYRLGLNGNPAQEAEPVYTPIVQEQRQLSLL